MENSPYLKDPDWNYYSPAYRQKFTEQLPQLHQQAAELEQRFPIGMQAEFRDGKVRCPAVITGPPEIIRCEVFVPTSSGKWNSRYLHSIADK